METNVLSTVFSIRNDRLSWPELARVSGFEKDLITIPVKKQLTTYTMVTTWSRVELWATFFRQTVRGQGR